MLAHQLKVLFPITNAAASDIKSIVSIGRDDPMESKNSTFRLLAKTSSFLAVSTLSEKTIVRAPA